MLEHLTIGDTFNRVKSLREPLDRYINISYCKSLASLHFIFTSLEPHTVSWASSLLAQLASPHSITKVTLDVYLSNEKQLWNAAWNDIVAKLGALNLQRVEVVHRGALEQGKARTAIDVTFSRLPNLFIV
ncbi:hypothetical protein B0H21DRAFT_766947 [Amylocystis lapponica]|nr:hypothetical protein B0H21DRAFT_766947 [Amylocystis lapponica]